MREEYEVAEVVLSTMRTVKAAKLYAEIPFILQNVEGCLRDADILSTMKQITNGLFY